MKRKLGNICQKTKDKCLYPLAQLLILGIYLTDMFVNMYANCIIHCSTVCNSIGNNLNYIVILTMADPLTKTVGRVCLYYCLDIRREIGNSLVAYKGMGWIWDSDGREETFHSIFNVRSWERISFIGSKVFK